jgi:hypothetical protein
MYPLTVAGNGEPPEGTREFGDEGIWRMRSSALNSVRDNETPIEFAFALSFFGPAIKSA